MSHNNKYHKNKSKILLILALVLFFILSIVSLINLNRQTLIAGKSYKIKVTDPHYIAHFNVSNEYLKDIEDLPVELKKSVKTVKIGSGEGSYTDSRDIVLDTEDYHKDTVIHEAIHVLDNVMSTSKNKHFMQCLQNDHYIINDDLDEVFVTIMIHYYKDKKEVKKLLPDTYKFLKQQLEEG